MKSRDKKPITAAKQDVRGIETLDRAALEQVTGGTVVRKSRFPFMSPGRESRREATEASRNDQLRNLLDTQSLESEVLRKIFGGQGNQNKP